MGKKVIRLDNDWTETYVWGQGYDAGQRSLQKAVETARLGERLRIIKLLEDRRRRTGDKYAGLANWEHRLIGIAIEETLSECIALIKGENK